MDQRCSCGKISYTQRQAARSITHAKKMQHTLHLKRIPKYYYPCDICGMYHLSSGRKDT